MARRRNESSSTSDEEVVLVRRQVPKLMGLNLSILLYVFLMAVIIVTALHFEIIVHLSSLRYGWVMTLMFGLLGPISVLFWLLASLFVVQGYRVLISSSGDFREDGQRFRRWVRTSRLLIVAFIAAMTQFFFGCFMFVTATSLEHTAEERMRLRNVPQGWKRSLVIALAGLYDSIMSLNYNLLYAYPLNIVAMSGKHWATTSLALFFLPLTIMIICARAQGRFYAWKFEQLRIRID